MSSRKVWDFAQRANLTHFLRIPLAAGKSYPQMKEAYHRLKNDSLFDVVPPGAFTHIDNLHLSLGSLRLDTPEHVVAACQLLSKLQKDRWRQAFAASEKELRRGTTSKSGTLTTQDQPFMIDLAGVGNSINGNSKTLPRLIRLYTKIGEPTGSLENFCLGLNSIYRAAGFAKINPKRQTLEQPILMQIKLADTGNAVRTSVKNPRSSLGNNLLTKIDARQLQKKYTGVAWIENVQLPEILITEMGRPRKTDGTLARHAFKDIAIAALPGFSETTPTPNDIDDRVLTAREC